MGIKQERDEGRQVLLDDAEDMFEVAKRADTPLETIAGCAAAATALLFVITNILRDGVNDERSVQRGDNMLNPDRSPPGSSGN